LSGGDSVETIRRAVAGEGEELEALQFRAATTNSPYRDDLIAHPDAIALPIEQLEQGRVYVLEQAGTIVGFMVVLPADGEDSPELDGLFVEPSEWGRGIGRALVTKAKQVAMGEGATTLKVVASPEAEGFYRRCGFAPHPRAETRFGPAIRMIAALSPRPELKPPPAAPAPRSR
jgi:GNAT superfamily N-acetyltransferase